MTSMERRKAARKVARTDTSKTWDHGNWCSHSTITMRNGVVTCEECGAMRLEESASRYHATPSDRAVGSQNGGTE